ncbi:Predicted ATPase [Streptosporangium subroseum]|uniref:Predicted ATPase n=1 Tax=Streptosporangium subroseum TaxID=106412 RepID=A0A239N8K7_9ACTN|nr:AAA family ATPase [Streptosporangium subroseum]SNT50823.1 Predicted ATPase [Streptosporangium subroseum]
MPRKIQNLRVKGYTSIQDAEVRLGDITLLVGANGAGKSNFIAALELLGRIADEELGLEVGLRGGAQAVLQAGAKGGSSITLEIEAFNDELMNSYEAVLVPAANDTLIFEHERITFKGPGHDEPWTRALGSGHRESLLSSAPKDSKKISAHVIDILQGCRVFHFQDTSRNAPVKQLGYAAGQDALRPDAGNLAAFLLHLREDYPGNYNQIRTTVQGMAPFFRDFVLAEDSQGRIQLRWSQQGVDAIFPAEAFSDGTLRYICLTTLLLQPHPPALLALDEPELGLHPFAIVQLAEMLRSAAVNSQIVVATQSVTLLNQFALDDLVIVERDHGGTVLHRPEPERLQAWLEEYSLGELWEKNVLGGRPASESRPLQD